MVDSTQKLHSYSFPTIRVTIARMRATNVDVVGVALCSPSDSWDVARGTAVASGRAREYTRGPQILRKELEIGTYETVVCVLTVLEDYANAEPRQVRDARRVAHQCLVCHGFRLPKRTQRASDAAAISLSLWTRDSFLALI